MLSLLRQVQLVKRPNIWLLLWQRVCVMVSAFSVTVFALRTMWNLLLGQRSPLTAVDLGTLGITVGELCNASHVKYLRGAAEKKKFRSKSNHTGPSCNLFYGHVVIPDVILVFIFKPLGKVFQESNRCAMFFTYLHKSKLGFCRPSVVRALTWATVDDRIVSIWRTNWSTASAICNDPPTHILCQCLKKTTQLHLICCKEAQFLSFRHMNMHQSRKRGGCPSVCPSLLAFGLNFLLGIPAERLRSLRKRCSVLTGLASSNDWSTIAVHSTEAKTPRASPSPPTIPPFLSLCPCVSPLSLALRLTCATLCQEAVHLFCAVFWKIWASDCSTLPFFGNTLSSSCMSAALRDPLLALSHLKRVLISCLV